MRDLSGPRAMPRDATSRAWGCIETLQDSKIEEAWWPRLIRNQFPNVRGNVTVIIVFRQRGGGHPQSKSPPCTEGNISRPPQRWLRPTAWPAGAISVSCPPLPPGALPSGVCMLKGADPDPGGRELAMSCR